MKKQKKKETYPIRNLLTGILLGSLILCVLIFLHQIIVNLRINEKISLRAITLVTPTLTAAPIPTSTPIPTATPTPEPKLVGYCLRAPILLYHHIQPIVEANKNNQGWMSVDPKIFEEQLSYLNSHGYTTLSVAYLVQALINKQGLPPKSIILTFDDGYRDIFEYAYPIIQKYHVTINLMIPTGLIGNPGYISWGELKQMIGSGLVFAYNHTWSHASLGNLPKEKVQYEIETASKQLEENLGKTTNIFAYPYGSENSQVISVLQQNNFIAALSTIPGYYQCDSFIMALRRNRVGNAPLSSYGL